MVREGGSTQNIEEVSWRESAMWLSEARIPKAEGKGNECKGFKVF